MVPVMSSALSEEQRRRIEENRRRAQERLQQRLLEKKAAEGPSGSGPPDAKRPNLRTGAFRLLDLLQLLVHVSSNRMLRFSTSRVLVCRKMASLSCQR